MVWRELLLGAGPFSASNATLRRECLERVGTFDERLRAAEDRDLWIRIAREFGTVQASGFVHGYRRHSANMTADASHMKHNMKLVLRKAFEEMSCPLTLRARARAHLYLDIAIVCYDAARRCAALSHLLKSFLVWPLPLGREVRKEPMVRWLWAVKCLMGKGMFERIWGALKPGRRNEKLRGACNANEV